MIAAIFLVILVVELICGVLSLVAVPTCLGNFFIRAVLKILGLYSGSTAQVKGEIKFAVITGALVVITFPLGFIVALMVGD